MRVDKSVVMLMALATILGLAAGAWFWRHVPALLAPRYESLVVLPETRPIADFALVDQRGSPFSLRDLQGRWSVLFFGFTSCPDVCPNTLFQLAEVRRQLQRELPAPDLPEFFLVSVDPDRDTPEQLGSYLGHFDPAFHGLSGDAEQLAALTLQLGIAYHVAPHAPGEREYAVEHSVSLLLLNPRGELHGVFPAPHDAARIAADLRTAIGAGG